VSQRCRPENTAIRRTAPSKPATEVLRVLVPTLAVTTLLDHGCGHGVDPRWYRAQGIDADGFDPHPPFGHDAPPSRRYDLVTSVYVVNVLDDADARVAALRDAARHVRAGGALLVVSRSTSCIQREATGGAWARHRDGWWSKDTRGTFQRGHSDEELAAMLHDIGLRGVVPRPRMKFPPDIAWALAVRDR
jgi:hypothetical protein